jgi:hypothetical protein
LEIRRRGCRKTNGREHKTRMARSDKVTG